MSRLDSRWPGRSCLYNGHQLSSLFYSPKQFRHDTTLTFPASYIVKLPLKLPSPCPLQVNKKMSEKIRPYIWFSLASQLLVNGYLATNTTGELAIKGIASYCWWKGQLATRGWIFNLKMYGKQELRDWMSLTLK